MSLEVIRSGLLDTLQDNGRFGFQHVGINPSGAMDKVAMQLANALVGNELHSVVIEMCFPAATLKFHSPTLIALAGGDFSASINGQPIPINHCVAIPAGAQLSFTKSEKGTFCYLAVQGAFQVQDWLQSASTNLKANAGGLGRSLKKGDQIKYAATPLQIQELKIFAWSVPEMFSHDANTIRCLQGPEWNWLDNSSRKKFTDQVFKLTSHVDRMGYLLSGEPLQKVNNIELLSTAALFGTMQLLPNGQMMCLMADHQTTGGYPRIAQVIYVDLPKLSQAKPHSGFQFKLVELQEAEELYIQQVRLLRQIQIACRKNLEIISR